MSSETCNKHDEDATNGCAKCEAELVDMLSSATAIHMTRMPPEHLKQKLQKADSDFLDRLLLYLITSLLLAGCESNPNSKTPKPIQDETKCTRLTIPDAGVQFVSQDIHQWACWRRTDGRAQCSRLRGEGTCP